MSSPADDRLNYVVGHDPSAPAPLYRLVEDDQTAAIMPAAFPYNHLCGFALFMLLPFSTFAVVGAWFEPPVVFSIGGWSIVLPSIAALAVIFVYLFTCLIFAAYCHWRVRLGQREGVRLIFDKRTQELRLPQQQQDFAPQEIVRLQVTVTRAFDRRLEWQARQWSELQLITSRAGEVGQWRLMYGEGNIRDFEEVLAPLSRMLPYPIAAVQQTRLGTDLSISTYQPRRAQFQLRHLFWLTTFSGFAAARRT